MKKGFIYQKLFWSVMKPDQAEKTIFCDMDESKMMASLNEDDLCASFGKPKKKKLTPEEKRERDLKKALRAEKRKTKKVKKAKIVSDKRINQLQMVVARMKQGYNAIADSLIRVDQNVVTLALAEKMFDLKLFPDANESELLQAHVADTGSTAGLNNVEQILFTVSRIPRLRARLESMKIKRNFMDDLADLEGSISTYKKAISQV